MIGGLTSNETMEIFFSIKFIVYEVFELYFLKVGISLADANTGSFVPLETLPRAKSRKTYRALSVVKKPQTNWRY